MAIEQKLIKLAQKYPELAVKKAVEWGRLKHLDEVGMLDTGFVSLDTSFGQDLDMLLKVSNPSPYLIDNPDLTSGDNPLNEI